MSICCDFEGQQHLLEEEKEKREGAIKEHLLCALTIFRDQSFLLGGGGGGGGREHRETAEEGRSNCLYGSTPPPAAAAAITVRPSAKT